MSFADEWTKAFGATPSSSAADARLHTGERPTKLVGVSGVKVASGGASMVDLKKTIKEVETKSNLALKMSVINTRRSRLDEAAIYSSLPVEVESELY